MPKTAVLDLIEVDPNTGYIGLRWQKLSSDGDPLGDYHRLGLDAEMDIDRFVGHVENHLNAMGFAVDHADQIEQVKQIASVVRTDEVIAAAATRREEAEQAIASSIPND